MRNTGCSTTTIVDRHYVLNLPIRRMSTVRPSQAPWRSLWESRRQAPSRRLRTPTASRASRWCRANGTKTKTKAKTTDMTRGELHQLRAVASQLQINQSHFNTKRRRRSSTCPSSRNLTRALESSWWGRRSTCSLTNNKESRRRKTEISSLQSQQI